MKHLLLISTVILFFACSGEHKSQTLKIACAANMQFALDSIAVLFESEHDIRCEITYGSSGMLTAQIENGAPYELFFSANEAYPEHLYGLGKGEEPFNYAKGRLLLVYSKDKSYQSMKEALNGDGVNRVGIADNRTAPYGMAANAYLESNGLKDGLNDKLVVGESIGQVNQYIVTGAVDMAFTSYGFKIKHGGDYQYLEVDQAFFDPIRQNAMVLTKQDGEVNESAEKMVKFIQSPKCKAVLDYFGYFTD